MHAMSPHRFQHFPALVAPTDHVQQQNPQLCAITFACEADWLNRHSSILLEALQGGWCCKLLSGHVVSGAGHSANKAHQARRA
jgi:hypothetical protein